MTPLLGTKTSSTPVGAKSGGDGRAARSLLSCALWRGMGRLWRGMGGMGRPEPLSAHRPHQQHDHSGFHETRDPRPGCCQARGVSQREFRGFHETRNTRHETRLLCFSRITAFVAVRFSVGARGVASQETAVRTTAPAGKSLFSSSPLFTIVRHCSPKKYCPAPVPSYRPVAAFLRVVARHGAAMARHGRHGAPRATVRAPSSTAT